MFAHGKCPDWIGSQEKGLFGAALFADNCAKEEHTSSKNPSAYSHSSLWRIPPDSPAAATSHFVNKWR